ncbi:MAG: membrane protein insertion efficiency factor YidD [Fidelibacterota bacterium]
MGRVSRRAPRLSSLPAVIIVGAIRIYRLVLSPVLPPACRFSPSCSQYAIEAFHRHPFLRAGRFSLRRLLRCHPWSRGGYDPVPEP